MFKIIQKNKGFTLIEVVAALVIITIVLLSFAQLFVQTNKTADYNNEKLVTINLADAALAKVRAKSYTKITGAKPEDYFKDTSKESDLTKMDPPQEIIMNGKTYKIKYSASQSSNKATNATYSEADLNLIKVVVTVTSPDEKTKGSSEGYVKIE